MRTARTFTRRSIARRAFTLVEILCVVVILGITSAIIVPALGQRNDQVVAAAARVVMADLMYAQNQAIVTQSLQYVNVDVTHQQYALQTSKPTITPVVYVQNPTTVGNYVTLFASSSNPQLKQATIQSVNADGLSCLAFDELGGPYSVDPTSGNATPLVNAATIVLKSGTFTLTVSVEPY